MAAAAEATQEQQRRRPHLVGVCADSAPRGLWPPATLSLCCRLSPPGLWPPATLSLFCDTLYTSRVLVLLEAGRTLKVEKGQVAVASDDTVALEYLHGRKDFVAVEG